MKDSDLLIRDKYHGDRSADLSDDLARLAAGEPLAYVIGWVPFLGLRIGLGSKPLIPRPETEAWAEELVTRLEERYGAGPFRFLDLCAGSGAVGLAALAKLPGAKVSFGELMPEHAAQIRENLEANGLDAARADIREGDLFAPFKDARFDIIATNPPYVPEGRALDPSVTEHEPPEALYAGGDGLSVIRRICKEASAHLMPGGELWMECDVEHIASAKELLLAHGAARAEIRTDPYGRPRVAVGYYA